MESEKGAGLPGRWVCRRAHSGSDVSVWGSIKHPRGVQSSVGGQGRDPAGSVELAPCGGWRDTRDR